MEINQKLLSLFSDPFENNNDKLVEKIQFIFDELPKSQYLDTHIGEPIPDTSWLAYFEKLPEEIQDSEYILKNISKGLNGQIRWNSPTTLHNINPPPIVDSVAISSVINMYNPNALWDFVSGQTHSLEKQIVRQLSNLVNWSNKESDGIFTFGGKACLIYAIRIGLNRCLSEISSKGIYSQSNHVSPVVVTSVENHYTVDSVCSLLGIGVDNCVRVEVNKEGEMDLDNFKNIIEQLVKDSIPIACIILSGGNTLQLSIDSLEEVREYVDEFYYNKKINYKPFIHFDTVVGWAWLFFKDYDFESNPLKISDSVLKTIFNIKSKLEKAELADSVGIDFHKLGMCSYNTSMYLIKNKEELHSINKDSLITREYQDFGNNFVQHHSLEHSRSSAPIFSAWVSLQIVGIKGFQTYIATLMEATQDFRNEFSNNKNYKLFNENSSSIATMLIIIPPKYQSGEINIEKLTSDQLNQLNDYNYSLYKKMYLNNSKFKILTGYVPDYIKLGEDRVLGAIRIFPMSPFMNKELNDHIIDIFEKFKEEHDKLYKHSKVKQIIPEHIPK